MTTEPRRKTEPESGATHFLADLGLDFIGEFFPDNLVGVMIFAVIVGASVLLHVFGRMFLED
jgi:hypothetical protein